MNEMLNSIVYGHDTTPTPVTESKTPAPSQSGTDKNIVDDIPMEFSSESESEDDIMAEFENI